MTPDDSTSTRNDELAVEVHPLQAMLRFLRAVRYRKGVLLGLVAASVLLGALYYFTARRWYQAEASLLVLQTGGDAWSTNVAGERVAKDMIPTYKSMLSSEVVVREAISQLSPEHLADVEGVPREQWVEVFRRNLAVHTVRDTNILDIAYRSRDPAAAAAFVDQLLFAYLKFMDRLHKGTAGELLAILTKEKARLEEQLRAKEAEMLEVRRRAGELVIRDAQEGGSVVVQRVVRLNETLMAAHARRLEVQARLAAMQAAVAGGDEVQSYLAAMMDSAGREVLLPMLGIASHAESVWRMRQDLLESKARLEADLRVYGPAHRRVREAEERIRAAEAYLQSRHTAPLEQLREVDLRTMGPILVQMAAQEVERAAAYEQAVAASYEEEKRQAIQLDRAKAELEIQELDLNHLRKFYDVVLDRIKTIDLSQESGTMKASVLRRPEIPRGPVWPRPQLVLLLAVVLGVGAGLGAIYVQELLDDHFRSLEELQARLNLPALAMVGQLEPLGASGIGAVHVYAQPHANEIEAFRTLRTALVLGGDGVRSLVVSSSEPGDGKTTVVVNLAAVYAQSGKRTLLIDADLRRPGLTPLLRLRGPKGLSAVLRDEAPVAESAAQNLDSVAENLDVLPAGPRISNPTELLASARMADLLSWADAHYDQVLIDSPPALVSDTAIIGRLVSGVLLVVRPEKNRRRVVIRAAEGFPALGINLLGVVVNGLAAEHREGYYGYGYGYSYGYGRDDESPENRDGQEPMECTPKTILRRAG